MKTITRFLNSFYVNFYKLITICLVNLNDKYFHSNLSTIPPGFDECGLSLGTRKVPATHGRLVCRIEFTPSFLLEVQLEVENCSFFKRTSNKSRSQTDFKLISFDVQRQKFSKLELRNTEFGINYFS